MDGVMTYLQNIGLDKISVIMLSFTILAILVTFLMIQSKKKKVKKSKKKNNLFGMYKFFKSFPLTKKAFEKVLQQVRSVYPANPITINREATLIMIRCFGMSFAFLIMVIFLSDGDLFYVCAGTFITYIIFKKSVDSKMQKLDIKLLEQFSGFLTSLRHYYHEKPIIEDAIYDTIDDLPHMISLHVENIYEMLISPSMNEKLMEYIDTSPNRFILTFVSICSSIKEYGDKTLENGSGLFVTNLNFLKEELNAEKLRIKAINNAFASFSIISLVGVIAIKPIELWANINLPSQISEYYKGTYGIATMILIFLISYIAYSLVNSLKDSKRENIRENNIWVRLSNIPVISRLLTNEINRHYSKMEKLNDKLKAVGDHTGAKAFLIKSVFICIASVLVTTVLLISAQFQSRREAITDFAGSFDTAIVPSEEYTTEMEEFSRQLAKEHLKDKSITREALMEEISSNATYIKHDEYSEQVAALVMERIFRYDSIYFHWYYLYIIILAGVLGAFSSYWYLLFKNSVINMGQEDEVNQFNTLMLILMHVDGMTVDIILEWMERFSYCFKQTIQECIINLESGEREALEKMKDSEMFLPFQQFCDSLMSIDDSGIASAFDEIQTERDYYLKKREQDNEHNIKIRSNRAALISFIPMGLTIVMYLIVPIGMLAKSMSDVMNSTISL